MSLSFSTIPVESAFGITIRNLLITQEPATDRLVVLLPGRGYTVNHPVMHYVRKMATLQGWDVLSVSYGFQLTQAQLTLDNLPQAHQDAEMALNAVLKDRDYANICIVGKSMGSPFASMLAQALTVPKRSLILLTPVRDAVALAGDVPTLAVIGTQDPVYDPDSVSDTDTVTWTVLEGLNHGLEHEDDWDGSIDALREVTAACERFLEAQ